MTAPVTGPDAVRPAATGQSRGSTGDITLVTTLRAWGPLWLRGQFALSRVFPSLTGLEPFRSVHFTHWCLVTDFAWNGPPQVRERPRRAWMLWETVYSAEVVSYIESFVAGIGKQIHMTWLSSLGFPGVGSVSRLQHYISSLSWPAGHFYWAHGDASVRTVLSALEVAREHRYLLEVAATGDADEFATVYRGFLRRRGADL